MNIIIIGSSTGGPFILEQVFDRFPIIPVCIIIVQHLPQSFIATFQNHIAALTKMAVIIANDGDTIQAKNIIIAPSGYHLLLIQNRMIILDTSDKIHGVRPAIDKTMISLDYKKGDCLMGIVLTGMGQDGAAGILHLNTLGAITIAQEPATAPIRSMPQSAIDTGAVTQVLIPEAIRDAMILFGNDNSKMI